MKLNVNEYTPQARVIFVKSYKAHTDTSPEDIIGVASNIGDVHEISSLSVELTVKNSPGSFSLTIQDTENKFIEPDNPELEIPTLKKQSKKKTKLSEVTIEGKGGKYDRKVEEASPGNSYEFDTFGGNDSGAWLNFRHVFVEVDGKKFVTSYTKNSANSIIERWAIDDIGNIIIICKNANEEKNLQKLLITPTSNKPFNCTRFINGKSTSSTCKLSFKTNKDFIDTYKDRDEQGESITSFKKGRCKISPMDRVVIFLSERFPDDESGIPKLVRAFTGVVSTVQEEYSNNRNTISIRGEDVTKYLQLSIINVNPALQINPDNPIDQKPDEAIHLWTNLLSGVSIVDIVKALTLGDTELGKDGFTQFIDGVDTYKLASVDDSGQAIVYDSENDVYKTQSLTNKKYTVISNRQALGDLFQKSSVNIADIFNSNLKLKGFDAYRLGVKSNFSFFQADFKTRRDILYKCAEDSNFTFYADGRGKIWFVPPRFNISHILLDDKGVYVIKNQDIINYGFIEDDSKVFTSVYVTTEPPLGYEGTEPLGWLSGSARSEMAILKYGMRIFSTSNPLIKANGGESLNNNLTAYARSLLQKLLAGRYQGQITIPGRVEIEPGNPVYIPIRNKIYYIESVQHSYTFGESFTTTLHLSYGRKPWDHLTELLSYSSEDDVYLTDGYLFTDMVNIDTSKSNDSYDATDVRAYNRVKSYSNSTDNNTAKALANYYDFGIDNLVKCNMKTVDGEDVYLYRPLAIALNRIYDKLQKKNIKLQITSAYRSYDEQRKLYEDYTRGKNSKYPVTPPGTSLHHEGKAIDIANYNEKEVLLAMRAEDFYQNAKEKDPVHFVMKGYVNSTKPEDSPKDPTYVKYPALLTDPTLPDLSGFK